RCGAPCAGLQDEAAYRRLIDEVCLFLEGRHDRLIPELRRRMEEAASKLEFERAARLRDQLRALEQVVAKQKIVSASQEDQDVIGLARDGGASCVQIFFVRGGKLIGREHFYMDAAQGAAEAEDAEVVQAFVEQYYAQATAVPAEVILPVPIAEPDVVANWLSERRGRRVRLTVPRRGPKRRLVEMVTENAALVLKERLAEADRRQAEAERALAELQEVLGLSHPPRRIEAFDISNLHGTEAVASMVVLADGRPAPQEYRRFKIRLAEGPNDFAMMQEVVRRRFEHGLREQAALAADAGKEASRVKFARFPDLVLIDGGKGQLHAACDVLRELGLDEIPVIGLAKRFEEIYLPDEPDPIRLDRRSRALHVVQLVRDEAHRFAITYHRQLRDRRTSRSALDEIPGVGPKRKKALLKHFGSMKRLRQASLAEREAGEGIPTDVARRIYEQIPRGNV
ncbi:MAG TPA: excinuclease ABC subunit UvrC, partial [Limnochordia bacterium]